jgi:hypothetical protein
MGSQTREGPNDGGMKHYFQTVSGQQPDDIADTPPKLLCVITMKPNGFVAVINTDCR